MTGEWWSHESPQEARIAYAGTDDSGLLWFFVEENWEALIKVLDGCAINGHYWVFGASTTDVGYRIMVMDTVAGSVREYSHEPGKAAQAITDVTAFSGCRGPTSTSASLVRWEPVLLEGASEDAAVEPGCAPNDQRLCFQEGRYEVSVSWSSVDGAEGQGRTARRRTDDSGVFWFFEPSNWEVLMKVLDGCAVNGHRWVFASSATDLGLEFNVRDTQTGRRRVYVTGPGEPAPALIDTVAFADGCVAPGDSGK